MTHGQLLRIKLVVIGGAWLSSDSRLNVTVEALIKLTSDLIELLVRVRVSIGSVVSTVRDAKCVFSRA